MRAGQNGGALTNTPRLTWRRWWRVAVCVAFTGGALILTICAFTLVVWWQLPNGSELRGRTLGQGYCPTFVDRNGRYLGTFCPDPEGMAEFTPLHAVPQVFLADLQFFEDASFQHHLGVSPTGLVRALRGRGGGSTLTMQVARMVMDFREHSKYRKAVECVLALKLETALTKDEILEAYVNRSRFGEGPQVGLAYASQHLFGKEPSALTRDEGILLISFLSRPVRARASHAGERSRIYRARLARLRESGRIGAADAARIATAPTVAASNVKTSYTGIFLDRAAQEVRALAASVGFDLFAGLVVETTLDAVVNDTAGARIHSALDCCGGARASFVMLNPENEVTLYATGTPLHRGDQDLIAENATIPGSQMKLLLYSLFVERMLERGLTPAQILDLSLPTSYALSPTRIVRDPEYPRTLTFRQAVVRSRNAPAYFVANARLTPREVATFAAGFGIELLPMRSIGVGSMGVSQLALVGAFSSILVRNGVYTKPRFVRRVIDARGDSVIYDATAHAVETRALSADAGQLMKQLLREVVYRPEGTARRFLIGHPQLFEFDPAAKTGTSSGSKWGFRGVTGALGEVATFSLLIQGEHLPNSGRVAVPIASSVLASVTSLSKDQKHNP